MTTPAPLPATDVRVWIGPNECRDVAVLDDGTLQATYMGGGDGPEDVTVTTRAGTTTAAGAFIAIPPPRPPTINGVDPGSGRGGTVVTVHGSGFAQ